jgi:hypothetical protein
MQTNNRNIIPLIFVTFLLVFVAHWISIDDFFIREGLLPSQLQNNSSLSLLSALPFRLKLDGVVSSIAVFAISLLSYFWFLNKSSKLAKNCFLGTLVFGFISEIPFLLQLFFPLFLKATPMIFLNNVALSLIITSQIILIYIFNEVRKIER